MRARLAILLLFITISLAAYAMRRLTPRQRRPAPEPLPVAPDLQRHNAPRARLAEAAIPPGPRRRAPVRRSRGRRAHARRFGVAARGALVAVFVGVVVIVGFVARGGEPTYAALYLAPDTQMEAEYGRLSA